MNLLTTQVTQKNINMYDLVSYLNFRIEALENANLELRNKEVELTTYLFEILEKDCPEDYKRVIRSEIFDQD